MKKILLTCPPMINRITEYNDLIQEFEFTENKSYTIGQTVWHQGINPTQQYTHILEVQYGDKCIEEDIERRT